MIGRDTSSAPATESVVTEPLADLSRRRQRSGSGLPAAPAARSPPSASCWSPNSSTAGRGTRSTCSALICATALASRSPRRGSGYSAQGAGALIGAIAIGQLADRLGRRMMLAGVMVGYGLTLIAGTLVTSYSGYLVQRFVLGLFMGGIFPVVVGIYVGLFRANVGGPAGEHDQRVFSLAISVLGQWRAGRCTKGDWQLLLWWGGVPPILLAGSRSC